MKHDFYQQYQQLKDMVIEAARDLIDKHGGVINVPYYCADDDIDDDVEQLIEDGFDVRINEDGENLSVLINTGITVGFVEIVALKIGKGIVLISKDSNIYNFHDITGLPNMMSVYEHLTNL